jgi:hypothetical protein
MLERGFAVRPLDGSAADLTNSQLRVEVAQGTADEVIGQQLGITVAAAVAGQQAVDRGKVTAQSLLPQQSPSRS